jgi:4-amino-4-deoxy-L-arabinose transferase-like glycosyltransferase
MTRYLPVFANWLRRAEAADLERYVPAHRRLSACIFLALGIFLLIFARSMYRPLDLDEHQFVAPPVLLVRQHARPYADYPYFHMPNLVYLYAGLTGWVPYKLLAARTISSLCGTATVLLLFLAGWRALPMLRPFSRLAIAGGMVLTFATSRLFTYTSGWSWNHDTAVLCTLLACLLHLRGLARDRLSYFAGAGFLIGMAVGIRLSFALVFLPFVLSLFLANGEMTVRRRLAALALATAGGLIALTPALILWREAPQAFVFGNLGYARLSTTFYQCENHVAICLRGKLRHLAVTYFSDPGNTAVALLALAAAGVAARNARRWEAHRFNAVLLIAGLLPVLLVGALGPAPTQYQYHYMLLPFLVLATLYVIAAETQAEPAAGLRWGRVVLVVAVIAGGSGLPRWYWPVVHLPTPARWATVDVHRAGLWVHDQLPSDARVLTIDPLIPLEGGLRIYPQFAVGRFVMHVGKLMTPQQRQQFEMCWGETLDRTLAEQPPDAILCNLRLLHLVPEFVRYAESHDYHAVDSPDHAFRMWKKCKM